MNNSLVPYFIQSFWNVREYPFNFLIIIKAGKYFMNNSDQLIDSRITKQLKSWLVFGYGVVFYKIWEHRVTNNTFENFATECEKRDLKKILRGVQMDISHNLIMWILIISPPWVLSKSSLLMMFLIPFIEKSTFECGFTVTKGKSDVNIPTLSINEHYFAKRES